MQGKQDHRTGRGSTLRGLGIIYTCCDLPTVEVHYYGAVLICEEISEWNVNKSGNIYAPKVE
jgi:hypothetical protein